MAATQPNHRASLLSGLRTGGVRSTSVPHTAAPGGSFNVPRFTSSSHRTFEEDEDEVPEIQDIYVNQRSNRISQAPITSAVDGPRFSYQQNPSRASNDQNPFSPGIATPQQQQAFQMQMMQMEIFRLQAIQAQQLQAELIAQNQRQQQQPQRRGSAGPVPASAGPYDLRFAAAMNNTRGNQADQLRSKLGLYTEEPMPMTAALNGKFGSRKIPEEEALDFSVPPSTPSRTTVISGGTVLGSPMSNNMNGVNHVAAPSALPSKSDSAVSWRRNGNNNSVLSGNRAMSIPPPSVTVTPPPGEPAPAHAATKSRPQPLRFSLAVSQPLPAIAIDTSDVDGDDASSTSSSRSNGSPTTPSSNEMPIPLSPREEATKKLYEGLGIGRPVPAVSVTLPAYTPAFRSVSQPTRQPRGPPSGADELGPKNFATRIRRKAIGGLSALLENRERRDVEVY